MGIDYMIGYGCVPKEAFTSNGLLERVKAGEQAKTIREFYEHQGEHRRPEDMGFEMTYRSSDGDEETVLLQLDDLLARRAELGDYEPHCVDCPANRLGRPFGCIGSINYPLSRKAEVWMLAQLPAPEDPLPFLLLKQGQEMGNTGARAAGLRDQHGVFFESTETLARRFPEMDITGEQLFELLFLLGPIQPKRAVMILLFMGAITRDFEADDLMALTPADTVTAERYPFLLKPHPDDDATIRDLKAFFHTLYIAFLLNRDVLLDV